MTIKIVQEDAEKKKKPVKRREGSKSIVLDMRWLLWIITLAGLALAFYCVRRGFTGSLPWVSAMVGLPWSAWGIVASFYLNMSKSDHREGGITMEKAKIKNFVEDGI